jgi:hypothetical protein
MKLLIPALMILCIEGFSQIDATTDKEGKKVILYKNGTWKYAKTKTATPSKIVSIRKPASGEDQKNEAMAFAMQLISTYFSQNCDLYQTYVSPELITMKGIVPVTDEVSAKICESLKRAVTDKSKTQQDYLSTYKIELLTRAEVEVKAGRALPEHYNSTEPEFYFLGFEAKEGATAAPFIWNDMFIFLLRKTNGTWKMKGSLD